MVHVRSLSSFVIRVREEAFYRNTTHLQRVDFFLIHWVPKFAKTIKCENEGPLYLAQIHTVLQGVPYLLLYSFIYVLTDDLERMKEHVVGPYFCFLGHKRSASNAAANIIRGCQADYQNINWMILKVIKIRKKHKHLRTYIYIYIYYI